MRISDWSSDVCSSDLTVEAAIDGLDAWEVLEARDVDLVVSDVEMPRMDGIELTAKMRGTARTRDIPIILLTARESDSDRLRGMQAGADAYLIKSAFRSEEHTSELQSLMRISYAVFCLKKKKT